jgi:hypothetical protein
MPPSRESRRQTRSGIAVTDAEAGARRTPAIPPLRYEPFEKLHVPRPVDRYAYVRDRCRGRRVLDLGAYDETEIAKSQHATWRWLHAEIVATAAAVLGVDASPALPPDGLLTRIGTRIIRGDVARLDTVVAEFRPDLVVAGELIEHTPDTLGWISALAACARGADFLATTPNATSLVNLLMAFLGRENNHPDHLHIYSYKTLATLAARVPLTHSSLTPYYYDPHLLRGRLPGLAGMAAGAIDELFLKPVQFLFPLTAFGWILEGRLGDGS